MGALRAMRSGNSQMARLLEGARESPTSFLGVHVLRGFNQDADRLSHPELAATVIAEAAALGFQITRLRPDASDWDLLESAIDASVRCARPD